MSKKVFVDITDDVDDLNFFQVDIRDVDYGVYIFGVEHYQEDSEIAKTEVVVGRDNLKELRDAIDLMIGESS